MAPDAPIGFTTMPASSGSTTIYPVTLDLPPERRKPLTFRNSKIIYYGPHACGNCGAIICKMGHEFGGTAFTYPDDGPIYPNTEWHPHVCDPELVAARAPRT